MKKFIMALSVVLFAFFLAGCKETPSLTKIELNETEINLVKGEHFQFEVTSDPVDFALDLQWKTTNRKVATINQEGKVTALSVGKASIIVSDKSGKTAKATVEVDALPVESIELNIVNTSLEINKNLQLELDVLPKGALYTNIEWTSSNEAVATVTKMSGHYGLVSAVGVGTATITVTVTDKLGKFTKSSLITVTEIPAEGLVIDYEGLYTMEIDDVEYVKFSANNEYKINYEILPNDASNQDVIWSSSDEDVLVIAEDGTITTKNVDDQEIVTITITSSYNEEIYKEIQVVVEFKALEAIEIVSGEDNLIEGNTYKLELILNNGNEKPSEIDLDWKINTTEYEELFTIDQDGNLTISYLTEARIHTINVVVNEGKPNVDMITLVINPVKIIIDESPNRLLVGEDFELSAFTNPINFLEDNDLEIQWESSEETLATVSEEGVLNALAVGEDIVVTAFIIHEYAGVEYRRETTITFDVAVVVEVESITIEEGNSVTLREGETGKIAVEINPSNASYPGVSFSSGDEEVATVDQIGTITAVSPGVATITVTSKNNPSVTAEIEVIVLEVNQVEHIYIGLEEDVEENLNELVIFNGEEWQFYTTLIPENSEEPVTYTDVTWKSSNTMAVVVNPQNGKITAVGIGNANVTVTHNKTGLKATIQLRVDAVIKVTQISLEIQELELQVDETKQVTVTITPNNATYKDFSANSSDKNVATVVIDSEGVIHVRGIAVGETIVTIEMDKYPDKTISFTVIVTE